MNANSIVSFQGGTGRNKILSQTLASTTETAFLLGTDTGSTTAIIGVPTATITGASAPLDPNANSSITAADFGRQYGRPNGTAAPWYSSSSFDSGRPFTVRILGTGAAVTGSANTITINLYNGTSISGTKIATTGAVAAATTNPLNFFLEVELFWDSTTQSLSGSQTANVNYAGTQTYVAPKAVAAVASVTAVSGLTFVASATWGNAAGGTISVTEFTIDQV